MSSNNDSFASCSTSTSNEPLDLEQLIRRCCDCFEGDPAEPEPKLPEWLFACSEWLTTDLSELMALFVALFQNNPSDYGHRVCSAVSYWIRHFPAHFDGNPQLCRVLSRLKRLAAADQSAVPRPLVEELLDISAIPSYAWLRNPSTRNPVSRHVSLCFEQWTAEDIATSMSHIDHKALSRISVSELKHYVKLGRLSGLCPHLERSITVFNCFSGWVQATILSKPGAAERAEVITKFVQVARHLRRQSNFNTLMAVIGGVKHSNIDRLAQTRALLRLEVAEELDALTELLSYNNNYAKYRRALREVGHRFRIPIMGVHLKDLISFWHSASLEQFERSRQISERCLSQLALLLAHFLSVDRTTPNFGDANLDLINTLKVLFDIRYDEQELYNQSLKREPRGEATSSRQHSSESDQPPAVLADWAKGVCRQPDPHSVDKHIAAMVDAVFKHYDQDRNGCIRKAEFEQFIGNFAFMTAQCPVETGQEGLISRDEMHEFFSRRLNKIRNGLARHQWTDWHFLVPATCAHCNKMLWMRHGTRCSQCALASHEACSLSLNADCSSRSLAGAESGSARPPTESTGLSGWLNASLSPRFATLGPISGSSRFYVNGRADTDRTGVSARQNKGIRRVRTSSSSTSEGSREAIAGSRREERPAPALFNSSGGFRSSFRNLLRTLDSKAKGSRAGSEGTAAATSTEEFEVAGQHQPQEPRASLACEEVFEEDPFTISQQQQQQQQQQTKEDHKGS